jgi:hypothetical protein
VGKSILLLISFILIVTCKNYSIGIVYSSENIDSLVQEADAVVLSNYEIVNILSESSVEYTVHRKILIKNENGEENSTVILTESEFKEVNDIEAFIIDTMGNILKELDEDEIEEAELSPGYVFYSGRSYKWFSLKHHTYPYILDYTYTISINSLFFWPDWYPQTEIPSLSATYKLIMSYPVEFSYQSVGIDIEPREEMMNSKKVYCWELTNIPQVKIEEFMPPEVKIQMAVFFKPDSYWIDSYSGSFVDWSSVAAWYGLLAEGKYDLPLVAKNEIHELVDGISEPKEKVRVLYNYLQKHSRYVAIEMGIGGWQPQSAAEVYENHYGDCKDLTTFMISMLDVAGIDAYPALALTRNQGVVNTEFPSNQFNHCITFVPLKDDTLWLECTASYLDMEDTHYSIEDIHVLVVKGKNSKLIRIPQKSAAHNLWNSTLKAVLGKKGDLTIKARLVTKGNQKSYLKNKLMANNNKNNIVFLKEYFGNNKKLVINEFSFHDSGNNYANYDLELNGVFNKFTSYRGKRMFINPNILNRTNSNNLPKEEIGERKFPVFYNYPYLDIDTVLIELPDGYIVESKPANKNITKTFAAFSATYESTENTLFYIRKLELKKNIVPVSEYDEFIKFFKEIIKSDKSKFVIRKR